MNCCVCGESLDFAGRLIGDIIITHGVAKYICKECNEQKKEMVKSTGGGYY